MALALQLLLVVVNEILGLSLNWLMLDDVVSAMLRLVVLFVMELVQEVVMELSVLQVVVVRWALLLSLAHLWELALLALPSLESKLLEWLLLLLLLLLLLWLLLL